MPERIVVSFRGVANVEVDGGRSYLDRAIAIKTRTEALGATLCSWSAQTFSFELDPGQLDAAVDLAVSAVRETGAAEDGFRVGIAHGPMDNLCEGTLTEVLSWGTPLLVSVSLARVARPGEVLLDPKIVASRPGEMLLSGMRVAMDSGRKVRGARLDVRQPWRKQAARRVSTLREPALVGRDAIMTDLVIPLGCIGVLRAPPGAGGTRLLSELIARLAPSRSLFVTPVGASREPLGAIRRALSRAAALHGAPSLPEHLHDALGRLLAGEGTDCWSAAELIDAWLVPSEGRFGVLAIDDTSAIDTTSLEAIGSSIAVRGSFRAFVRLNDDEPLPEPLTTTPIGAMLAAGPLDRASAEALAAGFVGGAVTSDAARRWARRGGGFPLGIREAMAEGITTGDLCWIGDVASPRRRGSGRGIVETPRRWIERRIAFLTEGERAALIALAMLGGDASDTMIDALAVGMGGPGAHSAVVVETLIAGSWVARPEPGWLKLTSRTAREALLSTLTEDTRRQWHLAAAGMLRHYGGQLGHADAAWYAAQAGDHYSAAELALDAARAADGASLESAAAALHEFARGLDAHAPMTLPDDVRRSIAQSLFPPPETSRYPFDESGNPGSTTLLSDMPPSMEDVEKTLFDKTLFDRAILLEERAVTDEIELDDADIEEQLPAPKTPAKPASSDVPSELAELAKQALLQGDLATLEQLITQLRLTGEYGDLVERMSGFVALGRGAKAEALRKLRAAADIEQPPAQRARALLAYGVALAATGSTENALLEALSALARAREAGDQHGEEACARFLARLSSATGNSEAAAQWADVVKRVSAASPR